jgi:hypothetical protein
MADEIHHHPHERLGFEVDDANAREVIGSAIGLAIGTALVCIAMYGMFVYLRHAEAGRQPLNPMANPRQIPPDPRLSVEPAKELRNLREYEDLMLHNYGWVDPQAGIVRIPIDQAIDIVAQRGLPVRAPAANKQGGSNAPPH